MRKHKPTAKQQPNYAFNPNLNTSHADREAYEKYAKWCRELGSEPASQAVYLGMNRPDVTQPNNIDVILLA